MLTVGNLSKTLPGGKLLLRNISFSVAEGEFVGILGSSGVGKTILIRCLNYLTTPDAGEVTLRNGKFSFDVYRSKGRELREVRRNIAMVFQGFNLVGRLSVLENTLIGRLGYIGAFRSILGRFSEEEEEQAMNALRRLGVGDLAYRRAETLSGGEQQRVAIARALFQHSSVLLADEPVANLDPRTAEEIMGYFREITLEGNLCTLAVLHQPELVRQFCSRALAIKDGTVIYDGSATLSDEDIKGIY
jgi:phosphonate ABC transporter, ATP-binding protein